MFFNLFGRKDKSPDITFHDKTYAHTVGKMKACLELAKENELVIFIAWFPDTLHQFKTYFTQNGISEDRIKEYRIVTHSQIQNVIPIFVEHYPLQAKEVELAASLQIKDITVYNALDEPFFKPFGGEKIISLMNTLGVGEDEAIEHSMISKSIINAQKKIAKKITIEQPARSQKEWMEKNIK